MTLKYRVRYTEYERGWGSRPEGFTDFDTLLEAKTATDAFNALNTESSVPDWYMLASEPVLVDADIIKK